MTLGELGQICTPNEGRAPLPGVVWAADNGCFSTNYVGDVRWFGWLRKYAEYASTCLFATAPDVVGDAAATLTRSAPYLPRIRRLGFPAALVAQDGMEEVHIPWDSFDALFVGGSTEWKLSRSALFICREANARGKHVHMGRVNSHRRWLYAEYVGCDSVNGTFLAFGPDNNLLRIKRWVHGWTFFTEFN